jgi:GT2 family glycosyltransferase
MIIDVIILSYAKDDSIIEMNNNCINSIINSTTNHQFNIILVETDVSKSYEYIQTNVTVVQPNEEFNYNKFLNIGLKYCLNEWILISNNDTIYYKDFIEHMIESNKYDVDILSMSPMDDNWFRHKNFNKNVDIHYGYKVSYEITGWSILVHKSVLEKIGNFDEEFKFWYQDDDYANNLILHKIKHALITKSKITHLLNRSHGFIESSKNYEMTNGLEIKFRNKWKK